VTSLPHFLSTRTLRLLLFGGKGGVGKTTSATATALYLARSIPQANFLLMSTDPAHSLLDSLADAVLPSNLKVQELNSQECLAKFKEQHTEKFQKIALRGTFLDKEDVNQILDLSLPGMDELMAFLEISRWVEEGHYETILVDTAPAGHTMRLLHMPELMRQWLKALDALLAKHRYMSKIYRGVYLPDETDRFLESMAISLQHIERLLGNPHQCCFIPVMLAETMVIQETVNVVKSLSQLNIPIHDIVVNRMYPKNSCVLCAENAARQQKELQNFSELFSYTLWKIPLYPHEVRGAAFLETFWNEATPFSNTESPVECFKHMVDSISPPLYPAPLPSQETKLLLFAGKGGVGKTTISCATALRLAQEYPNQKILLFSTDPAHSLSVCLDSNVGDNLTAIAQGVTALEINAEAEFSRLKTEYAIELEEFLTKILPNAQLMFDREAMEKILDLAPPGLDEIMALTRVMEFLDRGRYDIFILDSAPTGHLIRLLELPALVDKWLKVFFGILLKYKNIFSMPKITHRLVEVSKNLKQWRNLLHNPAKSAIYGVSILTEMSWEETNDLAAACARMEIAMPVVFLNMATLPNDCALCAALRHREGKVLEKFHTSFPEKRHTLIYRQGEPRGLEKLQQLGQNLYSKVR
jgi:arsenite-transporting ATPase